MEALRGLRSLELDTAAGVGLCTAAAAVWALGLCIQRYSMIADRPCCCRICRRCCGRNVVWVGGLGVFGVANCLYFVCLCVTPLSLASAIFASALIWNVIIARWLLAERIDPTSSFAYAMIIVGIVTDSLCLPNQNVQYAPDQLLEILGGSAALAFLAFLWISTLVLSLVVLWYERATKNTWHIRGDGNSNSRFVVAMLCYPTVLGMWEIMCQLCLKALSTFIFLSYRQQPQTGAGVLWVVLTMLAISTAMILLWLRKCYSRFDITIVLPVEFAVLTTGAISGGLIVFREHEMSTPRDLVLLCAGMGIQMAGVVVLATHKMQQLRGSPSPTHTSTTPRATLMPADDEPDSDEDSTRTDEAGPASPHKKVLFGRPRQHEDTRGQKGPHMVKLRMDSIDASGPSSFM